MSTKFCILTAFDTTSKREILEAHHFHEINNFSLTEQYFPNNLVIMPKNPLYAYPILHLDFPNFKHHDMESNPTQ